MLKGKVAVITGASRGIGKAIAIDMAKNGADLAIVYSSNDKSAEEVVAEARALGVNAEAFKCNVADFEQSKLVCKDIVDKFKKIDILINNAGITKDALLLTMSEADFDDVISVNLKGAFNFTKHLSKHIIRSSKGRIINISSVSGLAGNAGQVNYAASKSGLIGMTKTIARELASRNVTCNAIAPGFIETDMTDSLPESVTERVHANIPLKRMGKAEEVASLASFLASDLSSYITGEVIKIDGGMYI